MKKILLTGLLFLVSVAVFAQPKPVRPMVNIGAELAFPTRTGSFGEEFSIGIGGSGKFEVPFTSALYGTATAGFISFYRKKGLNGTREDNKSYIPLKAGAKYYFNNLLFGEAEIGASVGVQKNAGTAFVWAPGIGFLLPVKGRHAITAGIRYEKWAREGGNINQIGVRVGYQF